MNPSALKPFHPFILAVFAGLALVPYGCTKPIDPVSYPVPDTGFVKGGDIGWLSQQEATGYTFYDSTQTIRDGLDLLQDYGINTVRLRVFVNPSNHKIDGHCSKEETVAMAVRAAQRGMRVMINFHYSDSWADPAKQNKPAAWANHSFSELKDDVYAHTHEVLSAVKAAGVTPAWVQIGNEIPGGMLWPEGSTDNFGQLAQLINAGYDATKAVDSAIRVIVHVDQGNNNGRFRWFFDNAVTHNMKFDIIGASYYPYWLGTPYEETIDDLEFNLNDMVSRYNRDVFLVEIGGDYTEEQRTYDMLGAAMDIVRNIPNDRGLGVIYWEPTGAKPWSGYQLSAWRSDGTPSKAMKAFLDF